MKKKMVVYLATPYSLVNTSKEIGVNKPDFNGLDAEIRLKRFGAVNKVAGKLIKAGFAVISPISQSHPIAVDSDIGGKFEYWAYIDYNLILRCDMIIVFCQDGWKESEGVQKEILFATQNSIPVFYVDEELRLLEV